MDKARQVRSMSSFFLQLDTRHLQCHVFQKRIRQTHRCVMPTHIKRLHLDFHESVQTRHVVRFTSLNSERSVGRGLKGKGGKGE